MEHQVIPIPNVQVPVLQQRMYGSVVNYHYLQVESNTTENNDCVYQFLIKNYSRYIKNIDKNVLMQYLYDDDGIFGVNTEQIQRFCHHYGISLYALDLEFKVFHKYIPQRKSHRIPPLVYVVANSHMYPVVEDNVRKSIFAIEKLKTCNYINNKIQSNNKRFDNELPVVINPDFGEIQQLQDCNVVYTNLDTLEPLFIHLFKTEQTIYQCNSYNRNIMQIQYKNNVNIQINADYQSSLNNCQQLQIPFKNQNNVQLANEAFEIYRNLHVSLLHSTSK
jgi:hypothetical protein